MIVKVVRVPNTDRCLNDWKKDVMFGMMVRPDGISRNEPLVGEPIYLQCTPDTTRAWDFCTAIIEKVTKLKEGWGCDSHNGHKFLVIPQHGDM